MNTNILIAGLGGVGGYFGGLLANHYERSDKVNIHFLCRGEHLKAIQENGLKIIKGNDIKIARPRLASHDPSQLGKADVILIAVKSYDLKMLLASLKPCIQANTILIPLLNGVDSVELIRNALPDQPVLDACVYIVARLTAPGVIENTGNVQTLYFGTNDQSEEHLQILEKLLHEAGLDANYSSNIQQVIWEKFVFLSPIATITSTHDKCIGDILSNEKHVQQLMLLVKELISLATKKGITLNKDIEEKVMQRYRALPYSTTTSMHTDYQLKKVQTEWQSLSAYVLEEAKKVELQVPVYEELYQLLKEKSKIKST